MFRGLTTAIGVMVLVATVAAEQSRRIGPKDRDVILEASADASYSTTTLTRVLFLPFSNALDYQEGSDVLPQNFIGAMQQKHPETKVQGPEDSLRLIDELKLTQSYRSFAGNYANVGVLTTPFLQSLGRTGKVDAVLMGRILTYGAQRQTEALVTGLGTITWNRDRAVAGMELILVRTNDARQIWHGVHVIEGARGENVIEVAKSVGTVFANFFGRRPY